MNASSSLPRLITPAELDDLCSAYDGFILDLWGVLIDGYDAFPGANDWLSRRAAEKKPVWFLSNASRDALSMTHHLVELGISAEHFAGITTSGQLAIDALTQELGLTEGGIYLTGPGEGQVGWPEGIRKRFTNDIAEASLILGVGSFPQDELAARQAPLAAYTHLPFLCANPDRTVVSGGLTYYAAGKLADYFAAQGGAVRWYGKPEPYAFHCARHELAQRSAQKILFIGDSLVTDVPGAVSADIDCLWLTSTGIHQEALGLAFNEQPTPESLATFLQDYPIRPSFAAAGLV
ncbi:HAD superfamily hydrolase (TIGR01459 family) [Pseudomonas duriflava]|uniref:HAD superfamily hydrolase (TIGR01459 family) n=1 Tax=Pseudomonas duriflava TaxID=459528 RepID=A0A562QNW8_9PSED|nr:TIGR01459 family HAD-type hydrolase [Pseudomonas duriflava]TWI58427.1 HAD superfamily hydrolase (TIGR01459 family) [Pseudomonas duriflava]